MGPRTLKSTCTVPCIAGDLPSPSSDGGGGGGAAGAGEREGRGLCGSLQGLVRDLEDGAGGRAGGRARFVLPDANDDDDRWLPKVRRLAFSCQFHCSASHRFVMRIWALVLVFNYCPKPWQ